MASWWNVLREEINGTIDDFREKGAWGAFKDATLDAVDLVQDAGNRASSWRVLEPPWAWKRLSQELPEGKRETLKRSARSHPRSNDMCSIVLFVDICTSIESARAILSAGTAIIKYKYIIIYI